MNQGPMRPCSAKHPKQHGMSLARRSSAFSRRSGVKPWPSSAVGARVGNAWLLGRSCGVVR